LTVRCPRCGTLYRRPTREAAGSYRCARCKHVFDDARDEPTLAHEPTDPDLAPDDEPAFALGGEDDESFEDAPAPEPAPTLRPRREPRAAPRDRPEPVPRLGTFRFAVRSWLAVSLAYAVFSIYLYTHPETARALFASVPLIGSTLNETRMNPTTVQLANVHGEYRRVKGDHLVFTIAGTAVNASPAPVRRVQVEGRVVGARELRQVVFCGAAPRDVGDLSLREIALLQTIEPPTDWTLGPAEQADFLVVFPSPPLDLREFSAEVVSVRADTRRRRSPAAAPTSPSPAARGPRA
jgi:hypothetical protein